MARRRMFGFLGEIGMAGRAPTGVGDSAYNPLVVGTGDYIHSRGDTDLNWQIVHFAANSGLGVFAWIWNHHGPLRPGVGTSPQYPNPSLDWFYGWHVGTAQNGFTDGRLGGLWPSEYFGPELSFLLQAHGDPGNVFGGSPPQTLDSSFTFQSGTGNGRLLPKDADTLGQILSVTTISGSVVEITLSRAHGISLLATRDVWIYALGRGANGQPADANLTGKFVATATATNKMQVSLAAPWNGNAGRLPGGVVFSPSRRITALSNPRDNLVRVAFTGAALDGYGLGAQSIRFGLRDVYICDVTGTATQVQGRKVYLEHTLSWRPLIRSDIATAAAVTAAATAKTFTRGSGSWTTTPAAGDVVRITGSFHNDGLHRLATASSTVLTLDASFRLFRDESIASCRVELLSRSVSFSSGAKTLTIGSGNWDATPTAGQKIVVQGSGANNKTFTVVSATSTVITVSESVATETSSCEVYLANEVEWDHGAAVNLGGWNSDGWLIEYGLWGSVFADCANGDMPIGAAARVCGNVDVAARTTFPSDTLSPELLTLALGYSDAGAAAGIESFMLFTSYGDALEQCAQEIRTRCAAASSHAVTADEIPLVIVNFGPSPEDSTTDPTNRTEAGYSKVNTFTVRSQTVAAASRLALTTIVDTQDLPHQLLGIFLTADGEVELGLRFWRALQQLRAGTASIGTRRGVPVYVYLSQSQGVGVNNSAFTLDSDPDFNGSHYDAAGINFAGGGYDDPPILRPRQMWIWDPLEIEFQEYAPQKNANRYNALVLANHGGGAPGTPTGGITLGPGFGLAGPEASLLLSLRKRHPEGVFLYKLAVSAAALGPIAGLPSFDPGTADLAQAFQQDWDDVLAWFHDHGLIPDVRGIFFDQGESDLADPYAGQYAANLDAFIDFARDVFSTSSTSRAQIPFVIGRLQSHNRMSTQWAALAPVVQAAQDGAKTRKTNVGVASMQGLPIGSDNVHRTYRAAIEAGYRLADALAQTTHAQDGLELDNGSQINPEMQAGTPESGSPEFNPALGSFGAESLGPSEGGAGAATATIGESLAAASAVGGDLLAKVEATIDAFLSDGALQSYSIDGFSATRAQLSDLLRMRSDLRVEANAAGGGQILIARRGRY